MKKILVLVLIIIASVCFADRCAFCPSTIALRQVGGISYCYKHYCNKHKEIHRENKCYRCDLESRVARGKAKCAYCDNTKKLTIDKVRYKFEAFCPDHYCVTHKCAFYTKYSGGFACASCESDKNRQYREEPLSSLFGMELGADINSIVATNVGEDTYTFTPDKQFRKFEIYGLYTVDGKICTITAVQFFKDEESAEDELNNVVSVLDKKYGRGRRTGIVKTDLYGLSVVYSFGYDSNFNKPKQRLVVTKSRKDYKKYEVAVSAYVVSEMDKMNDNEVKNDMDAL